MKRIKRKLPMKKILIFTFPVLCFADKIEEVVEFIDKKNELVIVNELDSIKSNAPSKKELTKEEIQAQKNREKLADIWIYKPLQASDNKLLKVVAEDVKKNKQLSISQEKIEKFILDNILKEKSAGEGVLKRFLSDTVVKDTLKFFESKSGKEFITNLPEIANGMASVNADAIIDAVRQLTDKYSTQKDEDKKVSAVSA